MNGLPTKILVATDGSKSAGADADSPSLYEVDMQWAQEMLDGQARQIEDSSGKVTKAYLREGEPDAEEISLAEEIDASMIVAGRRGLGRPRRPIGSVSSSIAAHAHCTVLVVREIERV